MLTVVVGDWDSGLNLLSFLTARPRILLVIVPVIFTVVFLTLQKFVKYIFLSEKLKLPLSFVTSCKISKKTLNNTSHLHGRLPHPTKICEIQ